MGQRGNSYDNAYGRDVIGLYRQRCLKAGALRNLIREIATLYGWTGFTTALVRSYRKHPTEESRRKTNITKAQANGALLKQQSLRKNRRVQSASQRASQAS